MTETQQTDLVSEARELLAKATPGPWFWKQCYELSNGRHWALKNSESLERQSIIDASLVLNLKRDKWFGDDPTTLPNWQLIARAPELLRQLADEVERLRKVANTPPNERSVCDCHTWPTVSEMHDYVVALERKVLRPPQTVKEHIFEEVAAKAWEPCDSLATRLSEIQQMVNRFECPTCHQKTFLISGPTGYCEREHTTLTLRLPE